MTKTPALMHKCGGFYPTPYIPSRFMRPLTKLIKIRDRLDSMIESEDAARGEQELFMGILVDLAEIIDIYLEERQSRDRRREVVQMAGRRTVADRSKQRKDDTG